MGSLLILVRAAATVVALVVCAGATTQGSIGRSCGNECAIGRDSDRWARRDVGAPLEYRRLKRAKYYYPSGGGGRLGWALHRTAPLAPPLYSHTPPSDYAADNAEVPPAFAPRYFSERPPDGPETLVDADVADLVRSLSKHDLDRIIKYVGENNERSYVRNVIDDERRPTTLARAPRPSGAGSQLRVGGGDTESSPAAGLDRGPLMFFTDRYKEEFPTPFGFRDDSVDFDISYTKNVESVIEPMADYKLENFGKLPLMNDESKMKSTDSYGVPHYTVTSIPESSESKKRVSGEQGAGAEPKYEAAPSGGAEAVAAARAHSDAHLKAVKIWTHRSVGAAYTVHDDGSLSPEKPLPRKPLPRP